MAAKKKATAKKKVSKKTSVKKAAGKPPVSRAAAAPSMAVTKETTLPKTTDSERRKKLTALRTKMDGHLIPASKLGNVYSLRRPTGIIEMDVALGGGFPAGGACMLSGPYNSGKTWLLFRTIAMQQQIYGESFMGALHIAETQMPYDQMRQAGIKVRVPDSVIEQYIRRDVELGLPPWDAEKIADHKTQVGHIEVIPGGTGEQVLQTVLGCVDANIFSVIGVDSITSLMPNRDAGKDMDEESARAAQALMMGRFWPKYVPKVNKGINTTSLLFTQQVRQNDSQYGKEWKVTGGKATEHYKLIDVAMWPGQQLRRQIHGKDYTVGKKTGFETIKGKAGTHDHIKGEFNFYYSEFFPGNVDVYGDLIVYSMQQGLLIKNSKGLQLLNAVSREPIDGMYAPTEANLRECLEMDFEFELEFRRHVLAAAGLKCLFR